MKRMLVLAILIAGCSTKQPVNDKPHNVGDTEVVDKQKLKAGKTVNESINQASDGILFKMGDTLLDGKIRVEAIVPKSGTKAVTLRNISGDNISFKSRFIYFNTDWKREIIVDNSRSYKEYTIPKNETVTIDSVNMILVDANEIRIDMKQ